VINKWGNWIIIGTVMLAGTVMFAWAGPAAAVTDAQKCQAAKLKITGKYAFCRLKAEAKAVKTGDPVDYTKCDSTFGLKWGKAETNGGGMCPTNGDAGSIQTGITNATDDLALLLSGGVLPPPLPGCGNGVAETGESCDGSDLNGETCATLGYAVGAGLACTAECALDSSLCETASVPSRFSDNGDGTATDRVSGLMWEQKDDLGGIHDKDDQYSWCANAAPVDNSCDNGVGPFDGTVKTAFLDVLNDVGGGGASCFAGHCDWRLPTVFELKELLQTVGGGSCSPPAPCFNPELPGLTQTGPGLNDFYWSATTQAGSPDFVRGADFNTGEIMSEFKWVYRWVRAVRGGS